MPTSSNPTLTPKQDNFCLAYLETGNATEAYRRAYDAKNMQADTIAKRAHELLANGKITGRLNELRAEYRRVHDVTVASMTAELEEAREAAMAAGQASAAVQATMGIAKLHGLLVDKREVRHPIEDLTDEELDRKLAEARAKLAQLENDAAQGKTRH
jgi:phage terminase small subunit